MQRGIGGVCGQSALQRSTRSVELVGQSVGTRRRGVSAGASLICAIASLLQSAVHVSVCCLQHILLVCVCLQQSLLLGSSALGSLVSGALGGSLSSSASGGLVGSTLGRLLSRTLGSIGSRESSSEIGGVLLLQLRKRSAMVIHLLGVGGV